MLTKPSKKQLQEIEEMKIKDQVDEGIQHYCSVRWHRYVEMSEIRREPDPLLVLLLAAANEKKRPAGNIKKKKDDNGISRKA